MFSISAFAQKKDTVFLKPVNQDGHSIYIDPSPDSEYYKKIADLSYTIKDKDYNQSLERLSIMVLQTHRFDNKFPLSL